MRVRCHAMLLRLGGPAGKDRRLRRGAPRRSAGIRHFLAEKNELWGRAFASTCANSCGRNLAKLWPPAFCASSPAGRAGAAGVCEPDRLRPLISLPRSRDLRVTQIAQSMKKLAARLLDLAPFRSRIDFAQSLRHGAASAQGDAQIVNVVGVPMGLDLFLTDRARDPSIHPARWIWWSCR